MKNITFNHFILCFMAFMKNKEINTEMFRSTNLKLNDFFLTFYKSAIFLKLTTTNIEEQGLYLLMWLKNIIQQMI